MPAAYSTDLFADGLSPNAEGARIMPVVAVLSSGDGVFIFGSRVLCEHLNANIMGGLRTKALGPGVVEIGDQHILAGM